MSSTSTSTGWRRWRRLKRATTTTAAAAAAATSSTTRTPTSHSIALPVLLARVLYGGSGTANMSVR